MIKIRKNVTINAPVDKVFSFMNDPHNLPEVWPSMVEVKNVKQNADGGYNFEWVYKMAGVHFDGASETIEFIKDRRIVTRSTKGIESKFTWDYEARGNSTILNVETEYKIPIPLIGKLAEAIILRENEREADILLANLKTRMEIPTLIHA